ncbi:hypothetical protein MRB53_030897 [Persea americana]|uniref:Uncharacterized protein n=1 Tax=Persea americana TaxID=3435 RepID=A0ACC2KMT7_PERAE|nr:hypothetical protein MRB53_030897 [Persea americana]
MGFSSATLKLAIPPHKALVSGNDANNPKRQMPTTLVQLRSKANHEPPQLKLSRRDAMVCFTTSMATTLLPMNPANARILNADIIQQFMEKFREMAGISKPKADMNSDGEKKKPPVPLNDQQKDKNEKSNEKAGNSKHEAKEAEKPQEKAENSKPKADVSKGDEKPLKPAVPQNSPSTGNPVEAKNPK